MLGVGELQSAVNQALAEAGGPRVELTAEGTCAFDYGDTLVVLERREPAGQVLLYAPLMVVGVVGGGLDEGEVLRALLSLNLTSADLLGASLALHPGENAVVLTYPVAMDGLDARRLGAALDRFLLLVDAWTAKLVRADSMQALLAAMTGDELDEDEGEREDDGSSPGAVPDPTPQRPTPPPRFVPPGGFA